MTQISPMLAVSDGNAAIKFYQAAFGAELLWHLDARGHVVTGLPIDGAKFFLAHEAPDCGTRSPWSAGFTTVRIELFVDAPVSVHKRAVATGAMERNPVVEHEHQTIGPAAIKRMLQGAVADRLVTSGLLESSSTNNRAQILPAHVLPISSPKRPLASYGRQLISIRKSVVPRGAPAALAGFSTTSSACSAGLSAWRPARTGRLGPVLLLFFF